MTCNFINNTSLPVR